MVIQGPSYSYNSLHIQIENQIFQVDLFVILFFRIEKILICIFQTFSILKSLEWENVCNRNNIFQLLSDPIFIRHSIMKMNFFLLLCEFTKNQISLIVGSGKMIFVNTTMIVKQTTFWSIGT